MDAGRAGSLTISIEKVQIHRQDRIQWSADEHAVAVLVGSVAIRVDQRHHGQVILVQKQQIIGHGPGFRRCIDRLACLWSVEVVQIVGERCERDPQSLDTLNGQRKKGVAQPEFEKGLSFIVTKDP